jgi:hypothetical protein
VGKEVEFRVDGPIDDHWVLTTVEFGLGLNELVIYPLIALNPHPAILPLLSRAI